MATQFDCIDCKQLSDSYMVRDEVWLAAWPTYKADKASARKGGVDTTGAAWPVYLLLCLTCLEKRLGRKLTLDDFTQAQVNVPIFFGAALPRQDLT